MTKLEWCGYPTAKKFGRYDYSTRLFVLTESTNVTDGQTDGHTDRHRMTAKALLACLFASRGKKSAITHPLSQILGYAIGLSLAADIM